MPVGFLRWVWFTIFKREPLGFSDVSDFSPEVLGHFTIQEGGERVVSTPHYSPVITNRFSTTRLPRFNSRVRFSGDRF